VDRFFVRDHFQEPNLSLSEWTLKVEGHVSQPLTVSFSDLMLAPAQQQEATLECAGNGSPGFAVSTGVWKGVPLSFLLAAASPLPGAGEVLLEGADEGKLFSRARPSNYARIVPLAHCLAPEALIAYELNRQLLPRANGFPARALLPAWYAMNSVKWLQRIVVLKAGDRPTAFSEAGLDQVYIRVRKGESGAQPLGRVRVKSAIAFPDQDARLLAGRQRIWGFAWGGEALLRRVLISTDAGRNWQPARLESPPGAFRWARWSMEWNALPGAYTLVSRAEDNTGQLQPLVRDRLREDQYELNQCARVTCSVR
jgi:DMSO/TMAO reductase YedYZ molybdopterin-dependent catalytic subunit